MKNKKLLLVCLVISSFFPFAITKPGVIKGKVIPAEAGLQAIAASKTDTFLSPVTNGVFVINGVKPGRYNLVIECKLPYLFAGKKGIYVKNNRVTNVGTIKLKH